MLASLLRTHLLLVKVQPRSQTLSPLSPFVIEKKAKLSMNYYNFKASFWFINSPQRPPNEGRRTLDPALDSQYDSVFIIFLS